MACHECRVGPPSATYFLLCAMPALLARLGPVTAPGEREVHARRHRESQAVPGEVLRMADGDVALLTGTGPPWQGGGRVVVTRWPESLPEVEAIWAARTGRSREVIEPLMSSRGNWTLDNRGVPCEIGFARTGASVSFVLNYAGWRIGDFPSDPIEVIVCSTAAGVVWIVTPEAVPEPAAEIALEPRAQPGPWGTWTTAPYNVSVPALPSPPTRVRPPQSPPPPPPPPPFDLALRFVDLDFADGAVTFRLRGRAVTVAHALSRDIYNAVRERFDEEMPEGVQVEGSVGPDGTVEATVHGLGALAARFERVQFQQFVRDSCTAPTWLDAGDLARRRPGGVGRPEPDDLLDIPEFGLDRRAEAFRRLFARRTVGERVNLLPGRAVIVPLPATDGGPAWFAWETVTDDHATYLFRPPDDVTRDRMLAWTQDPTSRRRELLDDEPLQSELGYVRRVLHLDEGDDPLGSWWRRLCAATGMVA